MPKDKGDALDDFSDAPLSPRENQKFRKIIQDQERMDWFWASLRIWGGWGVAIVGSMYAAKEYVVKVFKALVS